MDCRISNMEIKNTNEGRAEFAINQLEKISDIHEKMNLHFIDIMHDYQKEHREFLKYLAIISAGAAALAPQVLDLVSSDSRIYFYVGVLILVLTAIVSVAYIVSSIELNIDVLLKGLNERNEEIDQMRQSKMDFVSSKDYSQENFLKMVSRDNEIFEILKSKKEQNKPKVKKFKQMNYVSEYVIFFFTLGVSFLLLSITNIHASNLQIVIYCVIVFFLINLFSSISNKIFVWLGMPMDLVKNIPTYFKKS